MVTSRETASLTLGIQMLEYSNAQVSWGYPPQCHNSRAGFLGSVDTDLALLSTSDSRDTPSDLAGKTAIEQCQVDAIVDTLNDFMSSFPWTEKNQEVKSHVFNELLTREAPHLLQDLETYLGDKEWLIGNSVTWADFYWDICSTTLLVFKPDLLDSHLRLVTLRKKVQAIPRIAAWVQRRPQTKL
ncbi:PREDICTED: hematopoietic prostaglandin D synthase [Chinchilla lanigera]|uniref:hematopoietic prostaglandin D synthase n=1 Tax=Chinchilla lanigera TaxID=34839 RepID=UPI0006990B6C|nr:PREDICTED: hematopoietic prostaglandin D synthase [Chinchilla lanigera]